MVTNLHSYMRVPTTPPPLHQLINTCLWYGYVCVHNGVGTMHSHHLCLATNTAIFLLQRLRVRLKASRSFKHHVRRFIATIHGDFSSAFKEGKTALNIIYNCKISTILLLGTSRRAMPSE